MSIIRLNPECITCLLNKYLNKIPESIKGELRLTYMQRVLGIIANASKETSAPEITAEITELQYELFGIKEAYTEVKSYFNTLMSEYEPQIENNISNSEEPL